MDALPARPHLVDVVHQHNGVIDHYARQDNNPHNGRHAEGLTGEEQGIEHADDRQGHTEHDDKGIEQGLKLSRHDHIDQENGED